jgi:hypothetical protein
MNVATSTSRRPRMRPLPVVVALLVPTALATACAESRRALGDDCLKDQDCLSGLCVQLHCGAAPEYTDAMIESDAAAASDVAAGAADASADGAAAMDAPAEGARDASGDDGGG